MDKKTALITLINHSYLLTEDMKKELLSKVDTLSEEDVDAIGKFLALEKKRALETADEKIKNIDRLLDLIETEQAKQQE